LDLTREAVRITLNNDLRNNYTAYGADELLDFDTAVANTTGNHPNQINPNLPQRRFRGPR
jgi:hypothetical protein